MEKPEFLKIMETMREQFGDRSVAGRKGELIFERVKHLSAFNLQGIVDFFIGNSKSIPTVEDFSLRAAQFKAEKKVTECRTCKGEGYFLRRLRSFENGLTYDCDHAFKCHCPNGSSYPAYQPWHPSFEKNLTSRFAVAGMESKKNNLFDRYKN